MHSACRLLVPNLGVLTLTSAYSFPECNRTKQRQALAALELHARVELDRKGAPSWILGPMGVRSPIMSRSSDDPVESAITALNQIRNVFCASEDDSFALGRVEHDKRFDQWTVRIKQTYRGMDVVGPQLIVNMTANDVIVINGNFKPEFDLPTQPAVEREKAASIANDYVAGSGGTKVNVQEVGDLVVFVDQHDRAYLAYPVKISYWMTAGNRYQVGLNVDDVFVDAIAGSVVGSHALFIRD